MAHQWEPCLPGNEREAKIPFKLRENVKASPTYEILNGHELEQTPGYNGGQGSQACCSPWSGRVGHDLATEQQ